MKISQEIIKRARKAMNQERFDRKILKREAVDLLHDNAELECGHSRRVTEFYKQDAVFCEDCADEWMAKEAQEKK